MAATFAPRTLKPTCANADRTNTKIVMLFQMNLEVSLNVERPLYARIAVPTRANKMQMILNPALL